MQMNSYKYYQAQYKMTNNKEKKDQEEADRSTELLFIT